MENIWDKKESLYLRLKYYYWILIIITSRQNQHIKYLIHLLTSSAFRNKTGQYVIEGIHLLQSAPVENIVALFVTNSRINHLEIRPVLNQIASERIYYITDQLAQQISTLTNSREVIAIMQIPASLAVSRIKEDCILLDRIQDPGNMGTIIRTAVASGIKHILLSSDCVDVYMPKVLRATMGAHFSVNLYPDIDLLDFVEHYPYNVFITEFSQNSKSLYKTNLSKVNAWVFGNEGSGIITDFSLIKNNKIKSVYIPMIGQIESLNVAMAASICLFEQLRQRL